jgi:hypothetical protein
MDRKIGVKVYQAGVVVLIVGLFFYGLSRPGTNGALASFCMLGIGSAVIVVGIILWAIVKPTQLTPLPGRPGNPPPQG